MKEIIAVAIGFALCLCAVLVVGAYFDPHSQCVRAQVADKTHPTSEADAHLECGRWLNRK